jgi:hypothetical protein
VQRGELIRIDGDKPKKAVAQDVLATVLTFLEKRPDS